ncbi:MAG: hypothetical protein AAFX03_13060 [Pseudomonadota bacterium]
MRFTDFLELSDNVYQLQDYRFVEQEFSTCVLAAQGGIGAYIHNVEFIRCASTLNSFWVGWGANLENVLIEDFDSKTVIDIETEACLNGVWIASKDPSAELSVKPGIISERQENREYAHEAFSMDITNFHGNVSIEGVDVERVSIDLGRHFKIYRDSFIDIDWKNYCQHIDINRSIWKIFVDSLRNSGVSRGVFSIPNSFAGEKLTLARKELDLLRRDGYISN